MKRLVLRKGFTLQRTPEGAAQLVDARTGDALLLSAGDFDALSVAAKVGLEPTSAESQALHGRFQSFLVESTTASSDSFYELDIGDAPTVPSIPSVAPVTQQVPAVAPRPSAPGGRVPSFHELAIPAVGGVLPPAQKRSTGSFPAIAPPPKPAGAAGFSPAAPTETPRSSADAWSVLPTSAPSAQPSTPAVAPSALPDDWSVTQGLAEATLPNVPSPAGPHVAEAVSPMLPSLDDLVPGPHPGAIAEISPPSPPPQPSAPRPSPVPSVAPGAGASPEWSLPKPSPVPAVAPATAASPGWTLPRPSPGAPMTPRPSPVPSIPPAAPLSPRPSPVPAIPSVAPSEGGGLDSGIFKDVPPSEDVSLESGIFPGNIPPVAVPDAPPVQHLTGEQELRDALAAAAKQTPPAMMPDDEPLPTAELLPLDEEAGEPLTGAPLEPLDVTQPMVPAVPAPAGPEQFRSQEDNLRAAMEQTDTSVPQTRDDVQALISNTAKSLETPSAPPPSSSEAALPSSKKPMVLTFVGVMLLAAGVAASFMLRPGGGADGKQPVEPPKPTPVAVVDAGAAPVARTPEPLLDAGAVAAPAPEVDAGRVAEAVVDAGAAVVETPKPVDAGAPVIATPKPSEGAVAGEVVGRGRVKMGEVTAAAEGTVTWTVEEAQRVKSKQALGSLAKADGASVPLTSPQVGLAMIKQASGAKVTKGAVLAEIIYFEAWAKAAVKTAVPTPAWRCEVISEATGQRAPCKISVVTPKGAGAQVTVAIEPRWFDTATDARLELAPP